MNNDRNQQGGAQSIRRTIVILRSMSAHNETSDRLSTIAKDLGLPAPTFHRNLKVLVEEEIATFDLESKLYHLSAELYSLEATTHQFFIRDRYHTTLERISEQVSDATYLIIRSGDDGLCIDKVVGKFRVQILRFEIVERRVLGIGAAGQALLSFLPVEQREEIIEVNSPRYEKYYGIKSDEVISWVKNTKKWKHSISIH